MAEDQNKQQNLPSPAQMEAGRADRQITNIGFGDVLRALSLGASPSAPRLPEQASMNGQYFGGYPKGYTNRLGAKGTISFFVLRQIAERSPVLASIISTRQHQRLRFCQVARRSTGKGEVGFRVVHARQYEKDFKVPEGFELLARECEKMLEHPWRVFWDEGQVYKEIEPSFSSFSSKIMEDLLIINRPVIELGLDPLRIPRAFGAIDGANIIPTFSALKYLTSLNRDMPKEWETNWNAYRRTLQMVSDKYKISLDERTEHIYILAGKPVAGFRNDELIIAPMFPQSDIRNAGYPKSLTERAIFIILAEIMAMTSNSRYFEFGQMAEVLIAMKGNYNDKHIKDLESIFQGNMTGVNGMFRVPLVAVPGGKDDIDVIQLKQNHRDMLFDVYIQKLTNLACAIFRMHPSEINEAPRAGDNSGGLNQASQGKQIDMAQEQGLEAILLHEKTNIFDNILQRIDPDLRFEWDMGRNEQEQVTVTQLYAPLTTVNERRGMLGLDPISDEDGGNVIDNQFIQARNQQQQQQEQAEQAAAQQQQATQSGGTPPGGDGEDGPPTDDEEKPGKDDKKSKGKKDEQSEKPESGEDRLARIAQLQGKA